MKDWFIKMFINGEIREFENLKLRILFTILAILMGIAIVRWLIGVIIRFFRESFEYFGMDSFDRIDKKYTKVRVKKKIVCKRYLVLQIILILAILCLLVGFGDIPLRDIGVPKLAFSIVGGVLALIVFIFFCVYFVKKDEDALFIAASASEMWVDSPEPNWVTETTTTYESWDGGTWRETGSSSVTYDENGCDVSWLLNALIIAFHIGLFLFSALWYMILSFFTTAYVFINAPFNPLRKKIAEGLYECRLRKIAKEKKLKGVSYNAKGSTEYSGLLDRVIGDRILEKYWKETRDNIINNKGNFFFVGYSYKNFFWVQNVKELVYIKEEEIIRYKGKYVISYALYNTEKGRLFVQLSKNKTNWGSYVYIPDEIDSNWQMAYKKDNCYWDIQENQYIYACYAKEKLNPESRVRFLEFKNGLALSIFIKVKDIVVDQKEKSVSIFNRKIVELSKR